MKLKMITIGAVLLLTISTSYAAKDKAKTKSAAGGSAYQIVKMNGDGGKNIVEVAVGSKDHSTLVSAVKAADLVDTLTGAGPYTLFAPTNGAFDKLPKGTVETLLKSENKEKLADILSHHAAAPRYEPALLSTMSEIDMADGKKIKISSKEGKIFADGNEVKAVIMATNGIIYVVDSVILAK